MDLTESIVTSATNVIVLAGLPLLLYWLFHRRRSGLSFPETARRAGLQIGDKRYLVHAGVASLLIIVALLLLPPPLEPYLREGSAHRAFVGMGISASSIALALLYGVVQTGFSEELLFRGLVAGSLARQLPELWANLVQALIFLLPHLLILTVMPEMWGILPIVFVGALFAGWLRMRSGSILGPWLMHATANVTVALSLAARAIM